MARTFAIFIGVAVNIQNLPGPTGGGRIAFGITGIDGDRIAMKRLDGGDTAHRNAINAPRIKVATALKPGFLELRGLACADPHMLPSGCVRIIVNPRHPFVRGDQDRVTIRAGNKAALFLRTGTAETIRWALIIRRQNWR